jgi:hypothetical protein
MAYNDELRHRNHYIAAEALEPVRNARTIRVRRGKASVTDRPFAEGQTWQYRSAAGNADEPLTTPNIAIKLYGIRAAGH